MTHTLHPEIEKRIKSCAKNIVWLKEYPLEDGCVEIIKFHLLPYLNLPQPIENEPLPEKVCTACLWKKQHSVYSQEVGHDDFGWEWYINSPQVKMIDCKRCKGTWQEPLYDAKPKTYTLEQMEEEYDRWFTNWLLAMGGKKNDLKQSTPKIEKIDMDKLSMMLYAGSDSEWNSWSSDIPWAIKMLADYINNTLPTKL